MESEETFFQTIARNGASGLNVPMHSHDTQVSKAENSFQAFDVKSLWEVLFVGQNQDRYRTGVVMLGATSTVSRSIGVFAHAQELQFGFVKPILFTRVHYKDDAIGATRVALPQRSELILTTHVPYRVGRVIHANLFTIESNGRGSVHVLIEFQSVKHGGLAS